MKKLFLVLISTVLFAFSATAADMRIALVVKGLGIGFFEAAAEGGEEAAKEIGGIEVIYTGPASTTAEAQIEVINSLIAQKVDAIAISANDRDALVPIGKKAMDRGITVISWDSGIGEDGRVMNLDPSNTALIGSSNIKWMKNSMGDEGEFAILSATTDAPDQNTWIKDMEDNIIGTGMFSDMEYLGVVYGDDDPQKSTTEAEALLAKYPDLRGIISPTTVGVAAAAQVVESAGKCDQVQVTGLGTPNQMRPFLKSGCVKAFQLWDPSVEGEIAGWLSVQMVENGMKLSEGMTISVPDQGDVEINANNLIYAAPMLDFVPGNIDNFNF